MMNDKKSLLAVRAWTNQRRIFLELTDGRQVKFSAQRLPRLAAVSNWQLAQAQLRRQGAALRWEEIDEDLSVHRLVAEHSEAQIQRGPGRAN